MFNSIMTDPITLPAFLICLATAMALGVLTALVFCFRSRHSASFALTLSLLPMAVAVIIMLVNGSVGTGVAVAGAFALVRFRSVPGTGREIAAIFTAMALGLALGMGYIGVAVLFFSLAAALTLVLTAVHFGEQSGLEKQLKITLPENFDYENLFDEVFSAYGVSAQLERVKTTNMGTLFELTYAATFPDHTIPKAFLDDLRARNGNLTIVVAAQHDKDTL